MDAGIGNIDHQCTSEMARDIVVFDTQLSWLSKHSSDLYVPLLPGIFKLRPSPVPSSPMPALIDAHPNRF